MNSSKLMILLVSNINLLGLTSSITNNPLVLINNNCETLTSTTFVEK